MLKQIKVIISLMIARYRVWSAHRLICECSAIIELCDHEKLKASRALIYALKKFNDEKKDFDFLRQSK